MRYGDRQRFRDLIDATPKERREQSRSLYADDYPSRNDDRANAISAIDRRAEQMTRNAIRNGTTRDIVRISNARARMRGALARGAQPVETAAKGNSNS